MSIKVRVHSNIWRLTQVIGLALAVALVLVGAAKLGEWRKSKDGSAPHIGANPPIAGLPVLGDEYVEGSAQVVDGDTLSVNGMLLRLEGVDAPELAQTCEVGGEHWHCGRAASDALVEWIADRRVTCVKKGVDRYQRMLARCFADGIDMQSWIVSKGWALAYAKYSSDYVDAENVARASRAGIWRGSFQEPWTWRKATH